MMATHSPPSAMAWIAYTMNAVYWLVTLTSPALVGMRIGLIFLYGGLRMARSNTGSSGFHTPMR